MKSKLFILIAFLIGLSFQAEAQEAYVDSGLKDKMEKSSSNEFIHVNIILKDKYDILELKQQFENSKTDIHQRGVMTVSTLKKHAQKTQKAILEDIQYWEDEHPGSYRDLRSSWSLNMINLKANKSLIEYLSGRSDIESIEYEYSRKVHPIVALGETSTKKSPGGAEPGLQAINAPAMWAMGYTGRGRKTFNLDTGAWIDHPAIEDGFLGNYSSLSEAFFSLDIDYPKDKQGSHGTHTLGTQLGLDPATHDTIGAAFNAYYQVADLVATSNATVKPLSDFVFAFEWAMDPDGNPETTDDMPDVINNSWGYLPANDTELCDSYMNDLFIALESCGIAVVFAAGNEGSGEQTIGLPQHLNSNLLNVFSVGSVNYHDLEVSSFSSRGPTICPGEGALKIKPEVVAPGEEVRSCVENDKYKSLQGTSMACPHVSGAVLLLKEAFPTLTGTEILDALYNSAIDLGEEGEDNSYGRGLIDVLAAFEYLSQTHTPVDPMTYSYDLAIAEIKYPSSNLVCEANFNPIIVLENKGIESVKACTIEYWFDGEEKRTTDWSGELLAAASVEVELPEIYSLVPGKKELYFRVHNEETKSDIDLVNNQRVVRFNLRKEFLLPFSDDFNDSSAIFNSWIVENPDRSKTWKYVHIDTNDYSYDAMMMPSWGYGASGAHDALISPLIELPLEGAIFLNFKVAHQFVNPVFVDTLTISLSGDCAGSFEEILYKKGGEDLSTVEAAFSEFYPTSEEQWRKERIDISHLVGRDDVLFNFSVHSKLGNSVFIDSLYIEYDGEPYYEYSYDKLIDEVYPNPVRNQLMIKLSDKDPKDLTLTVYKSDGSVVLKRSGIHEPVIRVDMERYSSGVYVLELRSKKQLEYRRVIKK